MPKGGLTRMALTGTPPLITEDKCSTPVSPVPISGTHITASNPSSSLTTFANSETMGTLSRSYLTNHSWDFDHIIVCVPGAASVTPRRPSTSSAVPSAGAGSGAPEQQDPSADDPDAPGNH